MEEDQAVSHQPQRGGSLSPDRLLHTIERVMNGETKTRNPFPRVPDIRRYPDVALDLHLLRFAADMTLTEFSHSTGLDRQYIWRLERNHRHMTLSALEKAARAFGLTVKISFEKLEEQDGVSLSQTRQDDGSNHEH